MDAECTRLVNALGKGEKARQTRGNLSIQLGLSDRKLRKLIEQAQFEGIPIVSLEKGGYFLAENIKEVRRYIMRERHRQQSIKNKIYCMLFTKWFD